MMRGVLISIFMFFASISQLAWAGVVDSAQTSNGEIPHNLLVKLGTAPAASSSVREALRQILVAEYGIKYSSSEVESLLSQVGTINEQIEHASHEIGLQIERVKDIEAQKEALAVVNKRQELKELQAELIKRNTKELNRTRTELERMQAVEYDSQMSVFEEHIVNTVTLDTDEHMRGIVWEIERLEQIIERQERIFRQRIAQLDPTSILVSAMKQSAEERVLAHRTRLSTLKDKYNAQRAKTLDEMRSDFVLELKQEQAQSFSRIMNEKEAELSRQANVQIEELRRERNERIAKINSAYEDAVSKQNQLENEELLLRSKRDRAISSRKNAQGAIERFRLKKSSALNRFEIEFAKLNTPDAIKTGVWLGGVIALLPDDVGTGVEAIGLQMVVSAHGRRQEEEKRRIVRERAIALENSKRYYQQKMQEEAMRLKKQSDIEQAFNEAQEQFQSGRYKESIDLFESVIAMESELEGMNVNAAQISVRERM